MLSNRGSQPTLEETVRQLARARQIEAEYKAELQDLEDAIKERFGSALERARSLLDTAREDVTHYECLAREEAVQQFRTTGQKQVHQAVQVKEFTVLGYDEETAKAYAVHKLPEALKLDRRTFEKVAKVIDLNFVTKTVEPRATIARDLSGYLVEQREAQADPA